MSTLQKLHDAAVSEDKLIPVRYYGSTGNLTKGCISRIHRNGGITIQTEVGHSIDVRAVVTNGLAGPANPNEWCFDGTWMKRYASILANNAVAKLNPQSTVLKELFGDLKDKVEGIAFHHIVKWGVMDVSHLAGFVSVNSLSSHQQLSGWLVTLDKQTRYILDVRALTGVEIAPIH